MPQIGPYIKTYPISAIPIGLVGSLVTGVDRTTHHTTGVKLDTGLNEDDLVGLVNYDYQ